MIMKVANDVIIDKETGIEIYYMKGMYGKSIS